jgi:hypothetical protein
LDDLIVEVGGVSKKVFSIWRINAKKGKMNCANCAIAVDYTLAGKPTSALPWTYEKIMKDGKLINRISYKSGTQLTILEKEFNSKFFNVKTIKEIEIILKSGQRGIVYGAINGEPIGHVFNVFNEKGVVKFIDGQTGKSAKLIYDDYKLLPTNF